MLTQQTATLTELYDLYAQGALSSSDPKWIDVQEMLRDIAKREVTRNTSDLFGPPLEDRIEDVYGSLLEKFIKKKFARRDPAASIEPLLRIVARNDLFSAFRRSRSPAAIGIHDNTARPKRTIGSGQWRPEPDLFAAVRQVMPPFRFPEYPHIREAILAYLLSTWSYPGQTFLNSFSVQRQIRGAAYNAAIFDINRALIKVTHAA